MQFFNLYLFVATLSSLLGVDGFIPSTRVETNPFLKGPFKPVSEERSVVCKVSGFIPEKVRDSIFTRIGPNPMFLPEGGYHLFDGDGVVHWIRFDNNTHATYSNRFIQTRKLLAERSAGRALYPNIGDFAKPFALLKIGASAVLKALGLLPNIPKSHMSVANTNIVQHASRQLALCESGLPYSISFTETGLETLGVETYDGFLQDSFTAHPKIDLATGKMYGFGSDGSRHIRVYSFHSNGTPETSFLVTFRKPVLMHDFAITSDHILLMDMPLEYNMKLLAQGKIPVIFESGHSSRVGVIDKEDKTGSSLRWYDIPGDSFVMSHVVNAYCDHGIISLVSCDMASLSLNNVCGSYSVLHKITVDTVTGVVTRKPVLEKSNKSFDFPVINRNKRGVESRFTYVTEFKSGVPGDILKVDIQSKQVTASVQMDPGNCTGECVFVASEGDNIEEDDGYILSFVTSDATESKLCVWNARDMNLVGEVTIPVRIPLGFHANIIKVREKLTG